jgi:predicted nuclease of predicted toxin-antitoxin system
VAPKFLLDADISPVVAEGCREQGLDIRSVAEVMPTDTKDHVIFERAGKEGWILVTYNNGDFALLLGNALREGSKNPGVVFVDRRTIRSSDFGGLIRALVKLAAQLDKGEADASGGLFLSR